MKTSCNLMTVVVRFKRMRAGVLLGLLAGAHVWASEMRPPADLPPAMAVEQVLSADPAVRAALADVHGAEAEHALLKAGEHEFGVSITGQRRDTPAAEHMEWSLALERGLRLPGKRRLDERIGAQGVLAAAERVGEARHESARRLLTLWYDARQAALEAALWREQRALLAAQKRIVETRVKRGDAAQLELLRAESALALAESQTAVAAVRDQAARAALQARFPGLPEPESREATPQAPQGSAEIWLQYMLEHNHELLAIRRALEQAQLRTRRAEAERVPDPTVGLHFSHEQGGDDKIVGLTFSMPLPGENRRARAGLQRAQAESLAEQEAAILRRLGAEAAANWLSASAGVENWQGLADAARVIERHASLARRAHELGELGLSDTLLAQRDALEARLAEGRARLSANLAIARLMLDAHRLWPLSDAEHP